MFKSNMYLALLAFTSAAYIEAMDVAKAAATEETSEIKTITIAASDGKIIIERELALESQIVRALLEKKPKSTLCKIPTTMVQDWRLLIPSSYRAQGMEGGREKV